MIKWKAVLVFSVVVALLFFGLLTGNAKAAEKNPGEIKVAIIFIAPVEEPWNTSLLQAFERVKQEKPEGLDLKWDVVAENVYPPDAERVLNGIAKTGKYDVIWAHSTYADAVEKLAPKYPEILWVFVGSGNRALGGNIYWVDSFVHEPAYLMGMIAGMLTKTNIIGTVASFPVPNDDAAVNAYVEGAKSVNPRTEHRMTYIENWFDPPKAKESTYAQIAAGADFIYAVTFGPFEACREKDVLAFGMYVDQNSLAPETVVTSALALWDPSIKYIVKQWWAHKTMDVPYNAPMKRVFFFMKDGGSDIAPYHSLDSRMPSEVKTAVQKKRNEIMQGKFTVPLNQEQVTSSK